MPRLLHTEIIEAYEQPYRVFQKDKLELRRVEKKDCPLIMLHGWKHSLESLKSLGMLVSQGREVHLVDLPGFGHSQAPDSVWSTYDYADQLIRYLDDKGISRADFFGHSFGGKIAMCLAIKYPERIRNLILTSASGLKRQRGLTGSLRYLGLRLAAKGLKAIDRFLKTSWFKDYFAPRFGSKDYQQAGSMRAILVRSVNEDLTEEIKSIQARTLLLWGKEDDQTPVELAGRLKQLIVDTKLVVLDRKGHVPFEEVGAHLCAKVILEFLTVDPKSKESVHAK